MIIAIHKAQGLSSEGLNIWIDEPVPDMRPGDETVQAWEKRNRDFYRGEAKQLVDALQTYLPGGTLDALLAELCERKACMLRVPICGAPETKGGEPC